MSASDLISFAVALEDSGFDGIWLSDLPVAPVLDPMLALALLAGRTRRLRLGANVVPFGRSPFVLARTLAQLDQISEGRLLLSFVTGLGHPGERDALGLDGANRGAVLEDVLGRVRSCWAGEQGGEGGGAPPLARPVQDPLEVWLGGRGPKALDRVGRIADGWLGSLLTADEAGTACQRIQAAAAGAGREVDPEHFGMSIAYARVAARSRRSWQTSRIADLTSTRGSWCRSGPTACAPSSGPTSTPGCRSSSCARQPSATRGRLRRRGWPPPSWTSRPDAALCERSA